MGNLIKNMKVRSKIILIIVVGVISLIALGSVSLVFMNKINGGCTQLASNALPSVIVAEEINTMASDLRILEFRHVISTDTNSMVELTNSIEAKMQEIEDMFASYDNLATNDIDKQIKADAYAEYKNYIELSKAMLQLSTANQRDEALKILEGDSLDSFNTTAENLLKLVEFNKDQGDEFSAEGDKLYATGFGITLAAIIIISIVMAVVGMLIAGSITRPVKELDFVAQQIADEKLDAVITYESKDELGILSANFNKTVERLRTYVNYINEISSALSTIAEGKLYFDLKYEYTGEFAKVKTALLQILENLNKTLSGINEASESVASSSEEMAAGAQTLAEGATEQAGTVEELVATITDVTNQIINSAKEAAHAGEMITKVDQEVLQSNRKMDDMVAAMHDINEKSQQISNIVASIDDIATQTNLLALNAAIEAARAGEAGKGFAVVAEQVKVLAEQCANAAKDTVNLINGSMEAVGNGVNIATQTSEALSGVVGNVKEVTEKMQEMAAESNAQSETMNQVERAVESISVVVQNNSATAEETSAASEELSGQAQILKELVSEFDLKK